jgi:tight adherence protein C
VENWVWLIGGCAFVCVAGAVWSLRFLFAPDRSARQRVAQMTRGGVSKPTPTLFGDEASTPVRFQLSQIATPASDEERTLLRTRLIQANFRSTTNLEKFLSLRVVCAMVPPLISVPFVAKLHLPEMLVVLLGTAALGYYLPAVLLDWRIRTRRSAILRPFPDALDLLVCCVEAGLGIDAALRRVATEMEPAAPELSQELHLVNHEISAGVPRADALKHLDARTGLNEMSSLVSVLIQADRFGTSVAKALRIHAELVRTKRMLAAEEKAAQISPKLTVAMILFILPTLMAVLIGPAILNISKNLWPTLSGGGM